MDESEYVEASLAAFLKEHELQGIAERLLGEGPFRVVAGVYDFDVGFFDGAVEQTVESYEEAVSIASARREDVLVRFTGEILKIRLGVREGRLTGMEPLGAVTVVLSPIDQAGDARTICGFSVAWDFQRSAGRELYSVEWEDVEL